MVTFILGTEGFIELRKYMNLGEKAGSRVYLANNKEETSFDVRGKVGFPFFGLILDCLNRTETAMNQNMFKAAELAVKAQLAAEVLNKKQLK